MPLHNTSGSSARTSTPSTSTQPEVTSNKRVTSPTRVVLPDPVLPMMAVVSPGPTLNDTWSSTGATAPGYEKETSRNSTVARWATCLIGSVGGCTLDSVPSTSTTRSAATVALGIIDIMNVTITTDIRICTR